MTALAGKNCLVKAATAASAFTAIAATEVAGDSPAHTVYQVGSANQPFDSQAAITVEVNGTGVAANTYKLDRLYGMIIFNTALQPTDTVTVSGEYLPLSTITYAHGFNLQCKQSPLDASHFQDTFTEKVSNLKDVQLQLDSFNDDTSTGPLVLDTFFEDIWLANPDEVVVVEIWDDTVSDTEPMCRLWGLVTADANQGQIAAIQKKTITFDGTNDADYRMISFGSSGISTFAQLEAPESIEEPVPAQDIATSDLAPQEGAEGVENESE